MATPFPIPVTAAQVGTYFVGQYYQVLQQQPEFVHQFYSDASTMLRIDGNSRDAATAMLQIHALVMSLNYTGVEIKTAHSLESWNGGVIVMVSGSVQMKTFSLRRKFVQTFFLAPQEKGYFVLNDIFHFIEEDPIHHLPLPAVLLAQSNLDSKLHAPSPIPETVSNYLLGGDIHARDFVAAPVVKENGPVNNYSFVEQQQLQQVPQVENNLEDNISEESNSNISHQNMVNIPQDHVPASVEEQPMGEPQRHTYASILRVAKGQANKNTPHVERNQTPPLTNIREPVMSTNGYEKEDATEELTSFEDEGEIKSVYVRNLPPTVDPSEVEEKFKHFGKLCSDGVVIRSRKDVGVCYAFVEFEDTMGVQNAIKAGTVQVGGRQVYIEERRPSSNIPSRGGRGWGRGRGSYPYQLEAGPRGRFGARSFGRGGYYDGNERDYS